MSLSEAFSAGFESSVEKREADYQAARHKIVAPFEMLITKLDEILGKQPIHYKEHAANTPHNTMYPSSAYQGHVISTLSLSKAIEIIVESDDLNNLRLLYLQQTTSNAAKTLANIPLPPQKALEAIAAWLAENTQSSKHDAIFGALEEAESMIASLNDNQLVLPMSQSCEPVPKGHS